MDGSGPRSRRWTEVEKRLLDEATDQVREEQAEFAQSSSERRLICARMQRLAQERNLQCRALTPDTVYARRMIHDRIQRGGGGSGSQARPHGHWTAVEKDLFAGQPWWRSVMNDVGWDVFSARLNELVAERRLDCRIFTGLCCKLYYKAHYTPSRPCATSPAGPVLGHSSEPGRRVDPTAFTGVETGLLWEVSAAMEAQDPEYGFEELAVQMNRVVGERGLVCREFVAGEVEFVYSCLEAEEEDDDEEKEEDDIEGGNTEKSKDIQSSGWTALNPSLLKRNL